ncbi:MAG: hypothetical protein VX252_00515 [Myxococcota bacterium]|nr:hypothetical protein [Myxococcota bacterium]
MNQENLDGAGEEKKKESPLATWIGVARDHPLLSAALMACTVIGALAAWSLLPQEISALRRLVGGALLGVLSWLIVMMGRMLD